MPKGVVGHRQLTDRQRPYVDAIRQIAAAGETVTVRSIAGRVPRSDGQLGVSINATKRMLDRLERLGVIVRGAGVAGGERPIALNGGVK